MSPVPGAPPATVLSRAFDALEGEGAAERVEYFRSAMPSGEQRRDTACTLFKVTVPPEAYWNCRAYTGAPGSMTNIENGAWSKLNPATTGEFSPDGDDLLHPGCCRVERNMNSPSPPSRRDRRS